MWKVVNSINVWWFYIKNFLKLPIAYIGIFFMPLVFIIGLGAIMPAHGIFIETIGFSLLFIEAITFGATYFSIKKSTLTYNTELSNMKKFEINFAVYLLMITIGAFTLIYAVGMFILLEHCTNILIDKYEWDPVSPLNVNGLDITESVKIRWREVDFWAIIYYGFMYTIIIYSLSIFLTSFAQTQKGFFIMILGFITYTLIFGGIMITMFGASGEGNIPMAPTPTTPLVNSPWSAPSLGASSSASHWTLYVSYLNPLFWINEWGFYLFGNHGYFNIEFNNSFLITKESISNNLQKDFNIYFKLHEGTKIAQIINRPDLLEKDIYQLSYLANDGDPTISLYNYSNECIQVGTSIEINNLDSFQFFVPKGYVFSIKQNQSLAPNLKYFGWSESWQYNASLILPYIFVVVFEFLAFLINKFNIKNN